MEKEIKEKLEVKKFDNDNYKERFQFVLKNFNDDVICQRYFRINGITSDALESEELKEVMDEVVRMIQDDLTSKSRVYEWYTCDAPLKLTGFVKDVDKRNSSDILKITSDNNGKDEIVTLSDGLKVNKTFFRYPENIEDMYMDKERPEDGEFILKFSFLDNDKVLYERAWDANVYHKYVRNSINLSNSDIAYRGQDPMSLQFNIAIIYYMMNDKVDLVYHIIKKICNALSKNNEDGKQNCYTKKSKYGDKYYNFTTYNKNYVNGWREATMKKTNEYNSKLYPSANQINYIEKYY